MEKLPRVLPRQRLTDAERTRIAALLRKEYEAGLSIRQLCEKTGYSIGRTRRLLDLAGARYRQRGGSHRWATNP